jgi:F-type H+-transporting ATPase subunit alpha
MQAFAMFASDLDKSTQALLARGQRTTEILKQDQYKPMSVTDQILIIFAATNGYFDGVEVAAINGLETELYAFADSRHGGLLRDIVEKRTLDDALKGRMHDVLKEFSREVIEAKKRAA